MIEIEIDENANKQFKAIKRMIELSSAEGLLIEVIHSAMLHAEVDGIEQACYHAMYDWDIV